MQLLRKTTKDNSDKKALFEKGRINPANFYKDEWSFIKDGRTRENIAYNIQYLEFCINLYNDYEIYLTIESLLCKNIISTITTIIECALFDLVNKVGKNANFNLDIRRDFLGRIDTAYDMGLIDREMKDMFHCLRKLRNKIHLSGVGERELGAYTIDETNKYIEILEEFRKINLKNG